MIVVFEQLYAETEEITVDQAQSFLFAALMSHAKDDDS
jgi:hypothetical protein